MKNVQALEEEAKLSSRAVSTNGGGTIPAIASGIRTRY